jgi:hypothetical protein
MRFDRGKVADLLTQGKLEIARDYARSFLKEDLATRIDELIFSDDQDYPSLLEDIIVWDLGIKIEGL